MYFNPEREGRPRKNKSHRRLLIFALSLLTVTLFLRLRPDILRNQLDEYLPTPTPAPTPTPLPEQLSRAADIALDAGDINAAEMALATAVVLDPENMEQVLKRVRLLCWRRRYPEALELARESRDRAPDSPAAHTALAIALDWSGEMQRAAPAAQSALDLDPAYVPAMAALVEIWASTGHWNLAQDMVDRALKLATDNPDVQRASGLVKEVQGDGAGAISAYQEAARLAPQLSPYQIDIARAERMSGNTSGARKAYLDAAALDPEDPVAIDGLGLLAFDALELNEAARRFQQSIDIAEDYGPGHGHLGWVRYAEQDWESAAKSFERALEYGATSIEYYYELGLSYAYQSDCETASPWLDKALSIDPSNAPALEGKKLCP